ncbi:MAG: hypothetical protein F8N15_04420, partial [Methanobacterium sp.]|nr:hypothetical protein [Methanobacterium sp.]
MMETWDACYLSPANRPNPGNEAQTVDERWDSGIEASLEWLFHVDTFDVFIVVFPWLSKAFESTPAGVLKVLDIQDIRDWTRIPDSFAEPFQPDADVVRMVCARADVIWTPDQELTTRLSELCDATTLTVPHAEPVRAGWPRPRSEILRFGLVCSDESGDVEDIHGFLNVAETFIRDRLLPCEIVIGGPFCDLFSALDYPFLRVLDPSLPLDDFYRSVDVVLVLAESPTDQQIHAAGAMSRGKAVLCRSHFAGNTPPAHAFHELPSFEAMMRACRQIVGAAGLIDDLEAASIESMKRAARSVEYALHASLPARRNLPSGFVFVVASNALQDHGLVLDHICDAAHYVGCQSDVLFLVLGTVGDASRRAIRRLAALGRVILTEPPTVTGTERLPQPVFSLCVASYEEVLQSGQTAFWFTCPPPPRQTIAAPLPVTAVFPISVLAQ